MYVILGKTLHGLEEVTNLEHGKTTAASLCSFVAGQDRGAYYYRSKVQARHRAAGGPG